MSNAQEKYMTNKPRNTGKAPEPLPYDPSTTKEWLAEVDKWEWEPTDGGWKKIGSCPRCHHTMSFHLVDGTILGEEKIVLDKDKLLSLFNRVRSGEFINKITVPRMVPIACNCDATHTGRPDYVAGGCGPRGKFEGPESEISLE
jgi:hypothetical protein